MEYSIHELSHLSGVTTRTLRWYDQIGLLKPSRTAESGYRMSGRSLLRSSGRPAKPSGRFGNGAGTAGKADSIGEKHHQRRRKEGDHERREKV